jgi:hypothetical protein
MYITTTKPPLFPNKENQNHQQRHKPHRNDILTTASHEPKGERESMRALSINQLADHRVTQYLQHQNTLTHMSLTSHPPPPPILSIPQEMALHDRRSEKCKTNSSQSIQISRLICKLQYCLCYVYRMIARKKL